METEIQYPLMEKILIPLTETKNCEKRKRNGKFDSETDKFGYVHFRFRCISISCRFYVT